MCLIMARPIGTQAFGIVKVMGGHGYIFLAGAGGTGTIKWDNLVAYGATSTGFYVGGVSNLTVTNCVGANSTSVDFSITASSTGNGNASEDGTAADVNWLSGADNDTGIVPADEWSSLVKTESDFLHIKPGAPNIETDGVATTIPDNNKGIETNIRPDGNGNYSRGPHQFLVPPPPLGAAVGFWR